MRLWSIHTGYLDPKGIVALWREGMLALEVLKGNTKGYKNHPQLKRFKTERSTTETMKNYLWFVYEESLDRGYHFNPKKIKNRAKCANLTVTTGQLKYEIEHLKRKLIVRNPTKYKLIERIKTPNPHPMFQTVSGKIELWEIIK